MLLEASRASRAWRARILDSRLWKEKFTTEGWHLDTEAIERFERNYNSDRKETTQSYKSGRKHGRHRVSSQSRDAILVHKPVALQTPFDEQLEAKRDVSGAIEHQDGRHEDPPTDEEMLDAEDERNVDEIPNHFRTRLPTFQVSSNVISEPRIEPSPSERTPINTVESENDPNGYLEQPLMRYVSQGFSRLNYQHVFKQKRKLEENWNSGRYRSFQLPHRDHPEDAHTECVYTIQYLGKYLVSGSRDRTLRIWDLDTQRLVRKPLQGHAGSVLCLQFDNEEDEDIIVSGSSDTDVILWRFSTGQMIQQLHNAHRESVLNLRFDKRFLVTCSKDKTIKIWNRQELRPGDRDYPVKGVRDGGQCPSYILDMPSLGTSLPQVPSHPDHKMLLEPYSHLMTLDLHGAAVNAIQIYKDQLVSASGDRNLRIWNIHTGECTTKIEAHLKGIACVQYDGKRIVSGSSDNTIRIWDPVSHAEVARLEGHSRLVRTIQAAFADAPGGREKLEAEAAEIDRQWQLANDAGLVPQPPRHPRQAHPGSRKPRDLRVVGAKIPPSGGGGRWSRIVSGSYDETVIIWKKTEEDEWVIGHRLRQEEALTAAGPPLISRSEQNQAQAPAITNHPINQAAIQNTAATPIHPIGVQGPLPAHQIVLNATQDDTALRTRTPNMPDVTGHRWNPRTQARAFNPHPRQQQPNTGGVQSAPAQNPAGMPTQSHPYQPQLPTTDAQTYVNVQAGYGQPPNPAPPPGVAHLHPHHVFRPNPNNQAAPGGQPNARVFKLQFDARRIICCSQDPKIVGWDFANGDEEIVESSRFFSAPQ